MEEEQIIRLTPDVISYMVSHANYVNKKKCVEQSSKLKIHAYGTYPVNLINKRRPNESEEIKKYRQDVYVPTTQATMSKVISSLEKIRRSQDWNIQYDKEKFPSVIADGETLDNYCEYNYPNFTSITNWAFSVLLTKYLLDPNGIIAIIPEDFSSSADYLKPVAKFFDSEQIIDYVEGEYVVLLSNDKSTYYTHGGKRVQNNGDIYYILTKYEFAKYEKTAAGKMTVSYIYSHDIGMLPAIKAGGLFQERRNNETIYKSRISGMVPDLDEAAREYSDLQAEIIQHIHSEKYMFANVDCPVCNGTGQEIVKDKNGKTSQQTCHHCHGRGSVTQTSPYGEFIVNPTKFGENALPTPPIGYVQKSTEIAKFSSESIRQHIYDALAAINMEFLAKSPLAQSGVAKAYDQDELNNFVNGIAEDIVRILDFVYFCINEYRYKVIVPKDDVRRAMLPQIAVPTKYNIVSTSMVLGELKEANEAGVSPVILRELNIEYAKKQYCTDPMVAATVQLTFDLDPLFGSPEDSRMAMLANGGITELDYIISCNVAAFVKRAMRENPDFIKMSYADQMKKMEEYASEVSAKNAPQETKTINQAVEDSGLDEQK